MFCLRHWQPQQTEPAGDAIYQFSFNGATGTLTPHPAAGVLRVAGGDRSAARLLMEEVGPRHLLFRPTDSRFAYSSNEQDNSVTVYHYNNQSGTLQPLQTVSSLPPDFEPDGLRTHCAAARLVMHPAGDWVLSAYAPPSFTNT